MRKGFSLIEVLVSMALMGIVVIIVASMMSFIARSMNKNNQTDSFEQTKNDLMVELTNSVKWATTVDNLVLGANGSFRADGVTYSLDTTANQINRGTNPITPVTVKVTKFEVYNLSNLANFPSLKIFIEMQDANNPAVVTNMTIVVSQRDLKTT